MHCLGSFLLQHIWFRGAKYGKHGIFRDMLLTCILRPRLHAGADKFLHGQKLARFHLAFTWDLRNWTNFWTAKCASLGPVFSGPKLVRPVPPVPCKLNASGTVQVFVGAKICPDPCKRGLNCGAGRDCLIKTISKLSTVCCLLSRVSFYPRPVFLRRCLDFTSRKLGVCVEMLICFFRQFDRAYCSRARCRNRFSPFLSVLGPLDSSLVVYAQVLRLWVHGEQHGGRTHWHELRLKRFWLVL